MTTTPHRASTLLCQSCGLDLTGKTAMECPSCGHRPDRVPHKHAQPSSTPAPRHEITKPLVSIGVCALALTLLLGLGGTAMLPRTLLTLMGIHLGVSTVVMAVSRATWLGVDAPWGVTLVRLVAVVAVTWLALTPALDLPLIYLLLYLIPLGVFVIANLTLLELDGQEALLFGMLTLVAHALFWALMMGMSTLSPPGG